VPKELRVVYAFWLLVLGVCRVSAQQPDVAKANDPLADANAIQFQDYYQTSFYAVPDPTAFVTVNAMNLRGVLASRRNIVRATLPLITVSDVADQTYRSGLGDLTLLDFIVLTSRNASWKFGIGPLIVAPAETHASLGAGKWQAGADATLVKTTADGNLFGGLVTWQTSFAGHRDRPITRLATFQPLSFYQVGGGYYIRSTAISVMDFANNRYIFPMGLGVGKVFKSEAAVGNAFFEPQVTVYSRGQMQPTVQFLMGLNLQWFKKR